MLHIATSHAGSSRWIDIQLERLRRHVTVPFTTWGSISPREGALADRFDHVVAQRGALAGRLNHLAVEIAQVAAADDLLMFLAPDAFPIADPMPVIAAALERAQLLAVRRAENAGDPQPHPCFCATTVGRWRALAGDWSDGYPWTASDGARATDLGANLLRALELGGTPWVALERSNPPQGDPLAFAIYGDLIYHHGANEVTRAHRLGAPATIGGPLRRLGALRLELWERRLLRRAARRSQEMYERIAAGGDDWLIDVRSGRSTAGAH
jgi:hypothetical protein